MSEIKRYSLYGGGLHESTTGDLVHYKHHLAAIAERDAELVGLRVQVDRLAMDFEVQRVTIESLMKDLEIEKATSRHLAANIGAVTEYVSTEGSALATAVGGHIGDDVGPLAVRMLRHQAEEVARLHAENERLKTAVKKLLLRNTILRKVCEGDPVLDVLAALEVEP